jgi:hypothetical protein
LIDQVQGTAPDRRDKTELDFNMMMSPGAFISTPESDLHRNRRAILSQFFSKQSIRRIEPILQGAPLDVLDRLGKYVKSGVPIRTNLLYNAAASDVITEYAFKRSWNNLEKCGLNEPFFTTMADAPKMCRIISYFPRL